MAIVDPSRKHVVSRGRLIYERQLRPLLEPRRDGEFVAIDAESGDYEVAAELLDAVHALRGRHPTRVPCIHRVRRPAAFTLDRQSLARPRSRLR